MYSSSPVRPVTQKRYPPLDTRLYLCGFPKAGLHAVNLMVGAFLKPEVGYDQNWLGTFAGGGWTTEWVNDHIMERAIRSVRSGHYIRGHMGYSKWFEQLLYSYGVGLVFIYRDPRDVAVSQAHHVLSDDGGRKEMKHPGKALYKALPDFESVLLAVIEGLNEYAGLFERWAYYAGWLEVGWVHTLRFEDMIQRPEATAQALLKYGIRRQISPVKPWPAWFRQQVVEKMIENRRQTYRSVTFRKGKAGGWREAFTPRVKEVFKARADDWLIRLGYEEDNDW